eukprot:4743705-Amphidinium_carterae.1
MRDLNGLITATSSGCAQPVLFPGTKVMHRCGKVSLIRALVALLVWTLQRSHTSSHGSAASGERFMKLSMNRMNSMMVSVNAQPVGDGA